MANERIHFVGIGGIGVSALARYYLSSGAAISGSDLVPSEITSDLARAGAYVIIGPHTRMNVPVGVTKVIYTAAVPPRNPERAAARTRRIAARSYAEAVGEITRTHRTVTVSGSHGKSTTTAMMALIAEEGGLDPTVIIGTRVKEFKNSNFRRGLSGLLVLEADEWNKSFLNYSPQIAIVTNIDAEHLDTYKTAAGVEKAFAAYLKKVPAEGMIVANADDEPTRRIAGAFGSKVAWYSLKSNDASTLRRILKVPGSHNVSNALAALTAARILGVRDPDVLAALARFRGAWRRFEFKGMTNGAFVFNDYAHHPREIAATLAGARERFPMRRIVVVYQPHQYTRLQHLWRDFVRAFDLADRTILLPVYDVAGRESASAKKAVNSKKLTRELVGRGKNAVYAPSFDSARDMIRAEVRSGDAVLVMGAGDIYTLDLSPNTHSC